MSLLEKLEGIARQHGFESELGAGYLKIFIPYTRRRDCGCLEEGTITETVRSIAELRNALGY